MPELIGLDFETYGATDLPTHGLDRYASCSTFRPLLASIAHRDTRGFIGKTTFDLVENAYGNAVERLGIAIGGRTICAHNAGFEQRVLAELGLHYPSSRFIDSAVVARAAGAGSRLEAAAPQLLGVDKVEAGRDLMKLFSIPGKYQEAAGSPEFDPAVVYDHPGEWDQYKDYCEIDATLSLEIVDCFQHWLTSRELEFQALTMDMNRAGWRVDVEMVEEMQRRYLENQAAALFTFRQKHDPDEALNFNSLKQMKEWTAARGVKCVSFDEKHVERYLAAVDKKLCTTTLNAGVRQNYEEVYEMLETKRTLGGSSLKKLQVILNTANGERLRDQYLHVGAGQSWRTTGRSVQMQNLKRLTTVAEMDELLKDDTDWDNDQLAENIRQVFTSSDPSGRLIVGDFSSVESRGLAYLAGESWKLASYRQGKDMYKVLASQMFTIAYDDVTKEQRTTGKVGELSCGYGAGGGAVQAFAENMGVTFTEAEAAKLVADWRAANPKVVEFWNRLDDMLHLVVEQGTGLQRSMLADGFELRIEPVVTPSTLTAQHPGAQSVQLSVMDPQGEYFLKRYFHGCYARGRNICYYKPSDRKTGDLWRNHFVDPKTKQVRFYELYGGKLAGILTQSFCRELFFRSLAEVARWAEVWSKQVTVVGQFHDEIVLDWTPGSLSLGKAKADLEVLMSDPGIVASFPLAADIKDDYRYTK